MALVLGRAARWFYHPAMMVAAGWVAAATSGSNAWQSIAEEGAFIGAAIGIAAALSPKPWMGPLIAPLLGTLALALCLILQASRAGESLGFVSAMRLYVTPPGKALVVAFLTAGVAFAQVAIHPPKRRLAIHVLVAIVAWLLWWGFTRRPELYFLRFALVFSLGSAGALELAKRLSRQPSESTA